MDNFAGDFDECKNAFTHLYLFAFLENYLPVSTCTFDGSSIDTRKSIGLSVYLMFDLEAG